MPGAPHLDFEMWEKKNPSPFVPRAESIRLDDQSQQVLDIVYIFVYS